MRKNSTGALVARRREAMGISRRALSEQCGANANYVRLLESGAGPVFVLKRLRLLAAILGVTLDELASGKEAAK